MGNRPEGKCGCPGSSTVPLQGVGGAAGQAFLLMYHQLSSAEQSDGAEGRSEPPLRVSSLGLPCDNHRPRTQTRKRGLGVQEAANVGIWMAAAGKTGKDGVSADVGVGPAPRRMYVVQRCQKGCRPSETREDATGPGAPKEPGAGTPADMCARPEGHHSPRPKVETARRPSQMVGQQNAVRPHEGIVSSL